MPSLRPIGILPLLLAASTAFAQDRLTLVIGNQETQARISALKDSLNRRPGCLAVIPAEPLDADARDLAVQQAKDLVQAAWEDYRKFDEASALQKLSGSRSSLLSGCAGADRALLQDWQYLGGLVHFTAGRSDQARQSFRELAAQDPEWEPDPGELAPKIMAFYHEAKNEVAAQPAGLIELVGHPPGAAVFLDGREAGTLPVVLDPVIPGRHCLEIRAPGHGSHATWATLPEGGTLRQSITLFPDQAKSLLREDSQPRSQDLGELARLFGGDFLVLGKAEKNRLSVRVISASSGAASDPISCTSTPCLVNGILAAIKQLEPPPAAPPGPVALMDLTSPPEESVRQPPWYRKWWVWTLVGGALVTGCAVGLGLLLETEPGPAGYQVIVTRPE